MASISEYLEGFKNWPIPGRCVRVILQDNSQDGLEETLDFIWPRMYLIILENENHWLHDIFVEFQTNHGTDTLEDELEIFEDKFNDDELSDDVQRIFFRYLRENNLVN